MYRRERSSIDKQERLMAAGKEKVLERKSAEERGTERKPKGNKEGRQTRTGPCTGENT